MELRIGQRFKFKIAHAYEKVYPLLILKGLNPNDSTHAYFDFYDKDNEPLYDIYWNIADLERIPQLKLEWE
jgi:hypothetical protein